MDGTGPNASGGVVDAIDCDRDSDQAGLCPASWLWVGHGGRHGLGRRILHVAVPGDGIRGPGPGREAGAQGGADPLGGAAGAAGFRRPDRRYRSGAPGQGGQDPGHLHRKPGPGAPWRPAPARGPGEPVAGQVCPDPGGTGHRRGAFRAGVSRPGSPRPGAPGGTGADVPGSRPGRGLARRPASDSECHRPARRGRDPAPGHGTLPPHPAPAGGVRR